ncbi:MAG: GDP-mannose 4,6-dehydratase [Candidatus Desulforudaceae bacterium]
MDAVMHLAANSLVGESMVDPAKYCRSNVVDAVALLEVCREEGVRVQAHILALDDYKQVKVGLFSSGTASYRMALWRPGKTFPQGRRGPMKQESMKRYCLGFQNPATLVVERFNWPD